MLQPISFNVIRQALEWHGFPVPTLRQLSYSERNEDFIWAEYLATWPEHIVPQKYFLPDEERHRSGVSRFLWDLQACFCEDVEVRHLSWSDNDQAFTCILYVKVFKAIDLLAHWRTEIYS